MITTAQKQTAMDIVSVFETGSVEADYGAVAILKDGAGISYGKHQATDKGGTLDRILREYIAAVASGPETAMLTAALPRLERNETAWMDPAAPASWVVQLMRRLERLGQDPVMQRIQDRIFEEDYWKPAAVECDAMGLAFPLSWALMYDTAIHSGGAGDKTRAAIWTIRQRFGSKPPALGGDEATWAFAYAGARRLWLGTRETPRVQQTSVRMDAFLWLMRDRNWQLERPFKVLGVEVPAVPGPALS
jgi:chitosanase